MAVHLGTHPSADVLQAFGLELLADFDTALDRLAKIKGSTELRLKLIDAVKEEKKRFETSGLIPWSEPMQPHLAHYFTATAAAESKARRSYNSLIDAQLRAKNDKGVAALRAPQTNLVPIRVVARWKHFVDGKPSSIVVLNSNGRCGKIDGNNIWSYAKGVLIFRWQNPQAPGGVLIDTLPVSADETAYAGTNNLPPARRPKLTGVYVTDD